MRFQETEVKGVYTATVHDKMSVVVLGERDRSKAQFVNNSVTIRLARLTYAKKLAAGNDMPFYVGVVVTVKGDHKQSWLVTYEVFKAHKACQSDFVLTEAARKAYSEDSSTVSGFKPQITEAMMAPSKAPKPNKKERDEAEQAARNKAHVDKAFGGPVA